MKYNSLEIVFNLIDHEGVEVQGSDDSHQDRVDQEGSHQPTLGRPPAI